MSLEEVEVPNQTLQISARDQMEVKTTQRGTTTPTSLTEWRERLRLTHDGNERLSILLKMIETCSLDEFTIVYQEILHGSERERSLVLRAWMRADQTMALDYIREQFPRHLEEALTVALLENGPGAVAWAEYEKLHSLAVLKHLDLLPREEEIDGWMSLPLESIEEEEVLVEETTPEWVNDFPTGLSVAGTARQVVKLARVHPRRARYWLSNTRDKRARIRAAADIGWESDDLPPVEFDEWLAGLPPHIASEVLAGRLARLALENPNNPQPVLDEVARYQENYQLDQVLFFITLRLVQNANGDRALLATLIGTIEEVSVTGDIENQIITPVRDYLGTSFQSSSVAQSRIEWERFDHLGSDLLSAALESGLDLNEFSSGTQAGRLVRESFLPERQGRGDVRELNQP